MKYCKQCGTRLEDDAQFCTSCGCKVDQNTTNNQSQFSQSNDFFGNNSNQNYNQGYNPNYNQGYNQGYNQNYNNQGYNQNRYYGNNYAPDDAPSTGFAILSFFFPLIGFILWLVWRNQYPLKAKSCGKGALIGFIVSFVLTIILDVFNLLIFDELLDYYYAITTILLR